MNARERAEEWLKSWCLTNSNTNKEALIIRDLLAELDKQKKIRKCTDGAFPCEMSTYLTALEAENIRLKEELAKLRAENAALKSPLTTLCERSRQRDRLAETLKEMNSIVVVLWELLDNIDTAEDFFKPEINNHFRYINRMHKERFKYLTSDGRNLFYVSNNINQALKDAGMGEDT